MNKIKAWLIRKLGGYVYLEQSQKIVFKELPCVTLNFDAVLPPPEWSKAISESEKIKLANREAAEKIGRYIIDNGLYEITRNCVPATASTEKCKGCVMEWMNKECET